MLQGFVDQAGHPLQLEAVEARIRKDVQERRERAAMEIALNADKAEDEKEDDPIEEGKVEDKKRKFLNEYRPHQRVWNFVEDDPASKLPHLMRAQADPEKAYIDTRVKDMLTIIQGMGQHLRNHNAESWAHINKMTVEIFKKSELDMKARMEGYKKMLEEAAQK